MMKLIVLCCIVLLSTVLCTSLDKSYGPFKMIITNFDICFGPKKKDCTVLKANITGDASVYLNFQVLKNCAPSKGKIVASSNGKELARLHMNKPCEHLFLKPLLTTLYNASEKCMVPKGDYSKIVDIGAIAGSYFGGSFFYGNITFRAHLYNDECNFSCTIVRVSMSPK